MTIEELIKLLQELPKDAEVVLTRPNLYGDNFVCDPDPDYYPHQNKVYL